MSELTDEYFLSADDELVDYLEKQAEESIKETLHVNALNVENGYKLLSIQIVGIGSSFLLLTQKVSWDYLTVGITAFTFLWTWCAIYLVHSGLSSKKRCLAYLPPHVLYAPQYKKINEETYQLFRDAGFNGENKVLPVMRRYRLTRLCHTSTELIAVNQYLMSSLDRARLFTVLAPAVSLVASAITFCFS